MNQNRNGKGRGGFTLVETLLVTAILVILLGLSLVGVARYRDYLKITELDNEARAIFMAAENRAVLLRNSGRSASLLSSADPSGVYMLSESDTNTEELLPLGSIDPALREGRFRVLYDCSTGHVIEVFYAEGDFDSDLELFRKSRSERVSYYRDDTSSRRLVGWYSGDKAENIGTKPLPTPGVEVFIENGEELTLTVRYTMPEGLPAGVEVDRVPSVTLKYGGEEVNLWASGRKKGVTDITSPAATGAEYTWVLDSLEQDGGAFTKQFKGLFSGGHSDFGGDFTVTAGLTLHVDPAKLATGTDMDGYIDSAYYAQGTDNSLFANETGGGETACIANARHLQNLHRDHSGAGSSIVKAEQLCDVDCKGDAYNFIPIANQALASYNGKEKAISSLYVSRPGDAGLFGFVTNDIILENIRLLSPQITSTSPAPGGKSNAAPLLARADRGACVLKNIEVIDGSATGKGYAGGLVGVVNKSGSCHLESCRVYWNSPEKLVKGSISKHVDYVISGNWAGGLIGCASGNTGITGSFAATTVNGAAGCGGLVGRSGVASLTVSGSYADCYLTGGGSAGGLIGESQNAPELAGCYAAGFIMEPEEPAHSLKTAGLVNGDGVAAKNCYSVVRVFRDGRLERPATPLYGDAGTGSGDVRYLYTPADVTGTPFGTAFEYEAEKPRTHVYNLRHKLDPSQERLNPPYPFPGLKDLPHYGDWAELNVDPVPAGLAYYETYSDGITRMAGQYENDGKVMNLREDLKNPVVTKDGYALVFKGAAPASPCMVLYGAQEWTLSGLTWVLTVEESGFLVKREVEPLNADGYTLIPLPDQIVTGELADQTLFFQELEYRGKLDGSDEEKEESGRSFFFNPHFARTVAAGTVTVETAGGAAKVTYTKPDRPAEPDEEEPACVRAARHLYDLSSYQDSYSHRGFCFQQELDINYASYTGYSIFRGAVPFQQDPIGTDSAPFLGTYNGGFHFIQNVIFRANGDDLGLFGVFGADGNDRLEHVVYKMDPEQTVTGAGESVGTLAGRNCGTIENCAVYGVNMSVTGMSIGGLVGENQGKVKNCAAELANLSAGGANSGGLAGSQNGGSIENSYAVGRLEGESGVIAGLASGGGSVKNSYAAVDLIGSGSRYGLCGNGALIDSPSGWLKDVFVYRGKKYNMTAITEYKDSNRAVSFTELKGKLAPAQTPAESTVRNIPDGVAYGPSYEDKIFPYVTGVATELIRDQDTGVIERKATATSTGTKPVSVHYGLWPMPLPVGLAYYETYSNGSSRLSGVYEDKTQLRTLLDSTQKPVVTKDGYALVFEGLEDDIPAGGYTVKYGNTSQQDWTLKKSVDQAGEKYVWTQARAPIGQKPQEVEAIAVDGYILIPLPDKIVTGELPGGDTVDAKYYQKLIYGDGLFSARAFYFNPHFAGRLEGGGLVSVKAGTVKPGGADYDAPNAPAEPRNLTTGSVPVWAATCQDIEKVWEGNGISVRTARHFYALSCFQNTYVVEDGPGKRYYFKQELNLDYNTYGWYGEETPGKSGGYYVQVPIGQGTIDDGFKGAYNGGGHMLSNVFYTTQAAQPAENKYAIDPNSQYVGLFRYVEYISNVNYQAPSDISATVRTSRLVSPQESDLTLGAKVGTLIGGCFRASHCTAALKDVKVYCEKGDYIYIGGLAGYSQKMNGCGVEIEGDLKYIGEVSNVYAGGLVALVYNEAVNCTSKVRSLTVSGGQKIYAGGLSGGIAYVETLSMTRVVAGCASEIKNLRVTASGTSYAGGLIGRNDGGTIYYSYAVGAIGAGDTDESHHYSGLVGCNERVKYDSMFIWPSIRSCYSAVGLPSGSEDRNYNFTSNILAGDTIQNCRYLTGTWSYGGITYTALKKPSFSDGEGKTCEELKAEEFPAGTYSYGYTSYGTYRNTIYEIPAMKAGGTGYPFPVNTGEMLARYGTGNFAELSRYQGGFLPYPGDDWPKHPT